MADIVEIKRILKEIQRMSNNRRRFTENTMHDIDVWAKEVKTLGKDFLDPEDEVFAELDAAIAISKDYHQKHLGIENDIILQAIRHLEYAIYLFLERNPYFKI